MTTHPGNQWLSIDEVVVLLDCTKKAAYNLAHRHRWGRMTSDGKAYYRMLDVLSTPRRGFSTD